MSTVKKAESLSATRHFFAWTDRLKKRFLKRPLDFEFFQGISAKKQASVMPRSSGHRRMPGLIGSYTLVSYTLVSSLFIIHLCHDQSLS